jgi:hypothetical protein
MSIALKRYGQIEYLITPRGQIIPLDAIKVPLLGPKNRDRRL